jgi:threonine dehydratase
MRTVTAPPLPVSYDDVARAAERLEGVAHRTPVATSRLLDERLAARVYLKCENLQRAGAFKFRGAYNAISRLSAAESQRGVLTYSSGNHAQAVALASRLLQTRATIVMPEDAPRVKREATESYGARVVTYLPAEEAREAKAREIQEREGQVLIPPFDHKDVIAGQGTAARELFAEVGDLDLLLVPCGGGGLLSGSATAARELCPDCRVVGVEPDAGDDGVRSFRSGRIETVQHPKTIADGARTTSLGKLTFAVIRARVDAMLSVPDEALVETMRFVWTRLKLVVEPTAVLGLAAAFRGLVETKDLRIGAILTGGNVDPGQAGQLLGG